MKYLILLCVLLSSCATGRYCVEDKQVKYEIALGKGQPKEPKHFWHCYTRKEKGHEDDHFMGFD